ncbi:MAG TPA: hypothetical protein ENK41_01015 [Rhodobacteraceae bacterium]|nr:hypothetical protein [Paracoccaceae bacterium]
MTRPVILDGLKRFEAQLRVLQRMDGLDAILDEAALKLAEEARHNLEYDQRAGDGDGDLARSVFARRDEVSGRRLIGTGEIQGFYHEYGTQTLPPRPWLRPALNTILPFINHRLGKMIIAALRRVSR